MSYGKKRWKTEHTRFPVELEESRDSSQFWIEWSGWALLRRFYVKKRIYQCTYQERAFHRKTQPVRTPQREHAWRGGSVKSSWWPAHSGQREPCHRRVLWNYLVLSIFLFCVILSIYSSCVLTVLLKCKIYENTNLPFLFHHCICKTQEFLSQSRCSIRNISSVLHSLQNAFR